MKPDFFSETLKAVHHKQRRHHSCKQCWQGYAHNAHMKAEDTDRVTCNIEEVHSQRRQHGQFCVACRPEDGCHRIVNSKKGEGSGGEQQVFDRVFHNPAFNLPEDYRQQVIPF